MLHNPLQPVGRNSKHCGKTRPIRSKRTPERQQQASPVQIGRFAAPALAVLPILPVNLPTEYTVPTGLMESAGIALGMLDAGVLTHTSRELTPFMMVDKSMSEWFAAITRDLKWFEANLTMTNDLENLAHGLDLDLAKKHFGVESDKTLSFAINFATWYWFTLKDRIEALEAKVPGLGETAIHWLDKHVHPLCQAVTPNFTFYAAQHSYWLGEDDESLIIEEHADCGGDAEDYEIYRRADFDASFPEMAHTASEKLDKDALLGLLSHPDREVADLAAMLLDVETEDGIGGAYLEAFSEDYLPVIEPAICIAWAEKDDTVQIIDDYFNMQAENGGTDCNAVWTVAQSVEGILKARKAIERYISQLKKIENVLSIIAERNQNI